MEFEGQIECHGENTEKCKTIFVWIEKEIRKVDEDGNEDIITIFIRKSYCQCKFYGKFIIKSSW